MSDQTTVEVDETAAREDHPTLADFTAKLEEQNDQFRKEVREAIESLRKPDRTILEDLEIGNTEHELGRSAGIRVSRSQPTDPLYERLYRRNPKYRECRNRDLDHWTREFLVGQVERDHQRMRQAHDKLAEAYGGKRATTLEGAVDVSDPTAVLGGTGGHLLPQNMEQLVNIARDAVAVLEPLCMPLEMTSGTTRVPTAAAATAAMVAEGGTPSQGEPTFASEMLKAQKAVAFMKASTELIGDSAFNVVTIYGERGGRALGALVDVQIATSNGTAPNISEALSGGDVAEATGGVLTYEDLVKLFFALGQPYRSSATFAGNATTLELVSTLMDGNDHPILSLPGPVGPVANLPGTTATNAGWVGTIFGRPVVEAPFASGTLVFGDLSSYGFARREGIVAESSTHAEFAAGLVQFKFTERYDGRIIDTVGMKQMAGLTSVG